VRLKEVPSTLRTYSMKIRSLRLQLARNVSSTADENPIPVSASPAEAQAESIVTSFLGALFALLNENAIQYCVLTPRELIWAATAGVLELAVHPAYRHELAALFDRLPRDHFRAVQRVSVDIGADQFHFALLDRSELRFFRISVRYVHRNELLRAVQDEIFVRHQCEGNCWIAAPAHEFAYLLAKASQTQILTNLESQSLRLLVERMGQREAKAIVAQMFGADVEAEVVAGCDEGSINALLPELASRRQRGTVLLRSAASLVGRFGRAWRRAQNLSRPTGLVVTILGPDGAGKTTLSTMLFDLLGPVFGPQKLLLWRPEVLPRLSRQPSTIDLPHSKPPRGAFQSLARAIAVFLDYWVGHFLLVKPLLSRSALILYDRSFHDLVIDSRRYRYGGPSWVPRFLMKMLPRTESLFLILDAESEIILGRKQELPPEEVQRQLVAYRELAAELPNAHVIRTDRDPQGTASEMRQCIVDYLANRYERRHAAKQPAAERGVANRWNAWAEKAYQATSSSYSRRSAWLRKGFLAVFDQGLISGSNFLLAILLARLLPAEQYGAYALCFAMFVLLSFLQQGLFLEPMSVFGPSSYRTCQRQYLGALLWLQAALAGCTVVLGALAALVYLKGSVGFYQMALLGMVLSTPCVLLYWFARRAFYLQLRPGGAVSGALLYCAVLTSCIWFLVRSGRLSAFSAFLAMGFAALVTSFRQLWQLRPMITGRDRAELREIGGRHWRYGRWAVLGSLFIWIPWNIYYPVVAHFSGLAEVANFRALLNLTLPMTQTLSAFTLLFLPHASHVSQDESWAGAKGQALRIAAFFALGSAMYWIPICLFRAPVLKFLYAGHYSNIAPLIPWIGLSSLLSGVALGPTIAFRAMRSSATVCFIYFVSSMATIALGIPATKFFGIPGAVTCNVLSSVTAVVLGWAMLARQGRPEIASGLRQQEAVP
jgi:O-antigen/teichoic acid export membrane protein/thymidylate kinase